MFAGSTPAVAIPLYVTVKHTTTIRLRRNKKQGENMKSIFEILKDAGLEIADDKKAAFEKEVASNYKTVAEFEKKLERLKSYEEQTAALNKQIEELNGVDKEGLEKTIAEWKTKAENFEKSLAEKEAHYAYESALQSHTALLKFSSESAKRAFLRDASEKKMELKDGKLFGFDEFLKSYKETDAAAFAVEQEKDKPVIVTDKSGTTPKGDLILEKMMGAAGIRKEN